MLKRGSAPFLPHPDGDWHDREVAKKRVAKEQEGLFRRGQLFYGDNLEVLREHVIDESVDLIYLDPPFNSSRLYNQIFDRDEDDSPAQIRAFEDSWSWGLQARAAYGRLTGAGASKRGVPPKLTTLMEALHGFLEPSNMLAYLVMMAERIVELRRVLKPTGSLYLHCDQTASHYLKLILDAVFGASCFRNEVIWRYRRWPAQARRFQRMHDVLLFYTADSGNEHTFHTLYGYEKLAESTVKTFGTKKQRADFSSGHRKPSVEAENTQGPPLSDVWEVGVIAPIAKERTGYPTQKPEALLERVIRASSNEGDVVLDPFCGCGTAIAVSQRLGRRWIGIDVAHVAVEVIEERLAKIGLHKDVDYAVDGEPKDAPSAARLAADNPWEFQRWAVSALGADHLGDDGKMKKGADRGIDGYIRFQDDPDESRSKRVLVSVKAGKTGRGHVESLRGTIEREGAPIGVLFTMHQPTKPMLKEAAEAGFYGDVPRLQIISAVDFFGGKRPRFPGINMSRRSSRPPAPLVQAKPPAKAHRGKAKRASG